MNGTRSRGSFGKRSLLEALKKKALRCFALRPHVRKAKACLGFGFGSHDSFRSYRKSHKSMCVYIHVYEHTDNEQPKLHMRPV